MKCIHCGFDNPDTVEHCINCGERIDGKVMCPKCHSLISKEDAYCSKCGFKIPNKDEFEVHKVSRKKKKLISVFNKIFAIVAIVLMGTFVFHAFDNYGMNVVVNSMDKEASLVNFKYFVFEQWKEFPNPDGALLTRMIFRCALVVSNVIATTGLAIVGIKRAIRAIKQPNYDYIIFLAAIFGASAFTYRAIESSYYSEYFNTLLKLDFVSSSGFSYLFILTLFYFLAITIVKISLDGRSVTVAERSVRILMIIGLGFLITYMCFPAGTFIEFIGDKEFDYGIFYFFTKILDLVKSGKNGELLITSFVLTSIEMVLSLATLFFVGSIIVYLLRTFFSKKAFNKCLLVPLGFLSIMLVMLRLLSLVLSLIAVILFNKYMGTDIYTYQLGKEYVLSMVWCLFFTGLCFAILLWIRKQSKDQKLLRRLN